MRERHEDHRAAGGPLAQRCEGEGGDPSPARLPSTRSDASRESRSSASPGSSGATTRCVRHGSAAHSDRASRTQWVAQERATDSRVAARSREPPSAGSGS